MTTRSLRVLLAAVAGLALFACSLPSFGSSDDSPETAPDSWQQQAAAIDGIVVTDPATLAPEHRDGPISYDVLPPVGGPHNDFWQNCEGRVYDAPIANEHAVHSLEHGAVWITYQPSLPPTKVDRLAQQVTGYDYTMLSPFEGLAAPISLQAWGYQLAVDDAGDPRIAEFIQVLRNNAGPEAGRATCGGPNSITATGTGPTTP